MLQRALIWCVFHVGWLDGVLARIGRRLDFEFSLPPGRKDVDLVGVYIRRL
jgi:hypothetical protein